MSGHHLVHHLLRLTGINIFVGNLPLAVNETELKQEFVPFGEIISANIMNDRYIGSGQSKGYGYVEMAVRA